jgi:hypothetical protein
MSCFLVHSTKKVISWLLAAGLAYRQKDRMINIDR